ncbi:uncharacterized protein LOC132261723 [Phlebotomus argentipes]|uniref:uncharacterized protein LOC132261723 n=1 Tax=Phlebotomus argentipes TaxID=94469 RepID=UPI002892DECD|nr:uncharacterized protein LOC132261723 [Phlebotomus argentipes]
MSASETPEQQDYEKNVVSLFKISDDLKDDIVYCQKVLRDYIKVHQICALRMVKNALSRKLLAALKHIENAIRDLMKDQRELIQRLRDDIEKYHSTCPMSDTPLDTNLYNAYLSKHLYYHFESTYQTIEPVKVRRRFTDVELIRKYDLEHPLGLAPAQSRPMILLKPKNPRMSFSSDTSRGVRVPKLKQKRKKMRNKNQYFRGGNAVKRSRMKLLAALKNAKTMREKQLSPPRGLKEESDTETSPSNSHSSVAPSEEEQSLMPFVHLPPEPPEPDNYNQESFLRFFGLYTHSYNETLKNRRPERRKRNIQSTERTDFHYDYHDIVAARTVRGRRQLHWKKRVSNEEKAASAPQSRSSTTSPVEAAQPAPTCVICSRPGEHQLKSCNFCTNLFHVICHDQAYDTADYRPGEFVCPSCMEVRKRMEPDC